MVCVEQSPGVLADHWFCNKVRLFFVCAHTRLCTAGDRLEQKMYNSHCVETRRKCGSLGGKPNTLIMQHPRPAMLDRKMPEAYSLENALEDFKESGSVLEANDSSRSVSVDPLDTHEQFYMARKHIIEVAMPSTDVLWRDCVSGGAGGDIRNLYTLDLRITSVLAQAIVDGSSIGDIKAAHVEEPWAGML